jgi:hypothetical protein
MSLSTNIPQWCAELSCNFDAVLCVALRANGDSSYRDARALRRAAREKWGVESVTLSDSAFEGATCVVSKAQLLQRIRTVRDAAKCLLFVVSAHGYSEATPLAARCEIDARSEYLRLHSAKIYDFELRAALLENAPSNFMCVALVDTCHSGTMLDLDYISFDGVRAQRSLAAQCNAKALCVSACRDAEQAGEDISDYAGWGGKLVAFFLDYLMQRGNRFAPLAFYRAALAVFSAQAQQRSHPVFSFSNAPKIQ